jgi:hypothetical protein
VIPDSSGYVFTTHIIYGDGYTHLIYETNNKSTAFIPYSRNRSYTYYGGGFFGAETNKFKQLCIDLDKNIMADEQNCYIAVMHDESHLNHFCNMIINHKLKRLGIEYHVPAYLKDKYHNVKMIYLDKKKFLPSMSKNTKKTVRHGDIIINKYNESYIKH